MKTLKTWVGPSGMGVWAVEPAKWEELYRAASWPTKQLNDRKRAAADWQALYDDRK